MKGFRQHGDSEILKIMPFAYTNCLGLNSHLGILQTSLSSKQYILLSRNLMGGSRQIDYTEKLKSLHKNVKEGQTLNSHLGILQPTTSSKPYILLSRNLMEGFLHHGDSEMAKIIPFSCQRLPSWNSSNNIFFQTIYPFGQKLYGTPQADRLQRKAEIIPLRYQRGPSIKQPS